MKINLGVKTENSEMVAVPTMASKPYYPSLYIDKDLPLDGKVGDTITATVELKVKSRNENETGKKKVKCSYSFDVLNIEFGEDNGHISADANLDRKMKY